MKIINTITLVALALSYSFAQVEINDLKTPNTPGFTLMDEAPSSVDKPTTPAALGVSLLGLGKGGSFEVAPYWLKSHPKLNFDQYTSSKFPILNSLSLSVASQVKNDSAQLGVGVRFNIFRWRSGGNLNKLNDKKLVIIEFLNEDITPAIEDSIKKHKEKLLEFIDQPTLLFSAAVAYLGLADNTEFKDLKTSRVGAWINVTYVNSTLPNFKFILLNRYLKNPDFSGYDKDSEFYDFGLSVLYQRNKFGLSGEYVNRMAISNSKDYNRLAGLLEFKLIDNLYLTGTVGKNFDEEKDLFVLFGVNVGVSNKSNIKF